MKRVLQIMGGLNRGGLETFVMNMYRAIDRNVVQFDFLVNSRGDYAEEIEKLGGRIFVLPARNQGLRASIKASEDFFKRHATEYAACHLHVSSLSSIGVLEIAKKYNIPIRIIHAHSSSISKSIKYRWIHVLLHYYHKLKVKSLATHYYGCSDKALDWLFNGTGVRDKAVLIYNGIAVDDYTYNCVIDGDVRHELKIPRDAFVLGHVGRFIPLKNHQFIIDIFLELHRRLQNSYLFLVGDGETRSAITQKVKDNNIDNSVVFLGVRNDVNRILQSVDCFVMPSWFEGLPVSLVEAQAAGSFVVASDTISKDSKLTSDFVFVSIKDSPKQWADIILNNAFNYKRPNNSQLLKTAGFDSISTAKLLTKVYLSEELFDNE